MIKNQKGKYRNVPGTEDDDSKISVDKTERSAALKNETTEKARGFAKFEDFPQLPTFKVGRNDKVLPQSSSGMSSNSKSWSSIATKNSLRTGTEAFPYLPSSEHKQMGNNLSSERDNRKIPPVIRNGTIKKAAVKTEPTSSTNSKERQPSSVKKIPVQQPRNPHKKKRSDPIFLNFEDICTMNNKKRAKKQIVFKNKFQRHRTKELLSGNYLDSSNPIRSRGKHREIKKKKLTKLKLIIVKERIIKQKLKEKGIANYLTDNNCFQVIEKIDFKNEIKLYLDELNKRREQKPEGNKNQCNDKLKLGKSEKEKTCEVKNTKAVMMKENPGEVVPEIKEKKVPQVVHGGEIKFTSKFREYCDNILTSPLNSAVSELIKELVKLQDRQFARDPIKAKAKRRHVSGIREAKKYLTLKKAKLIIIAPNLEKLQMEGGVYDSINELKTMAQESDVPYGFALDRFGLGRCTKKNVSVSAFAVLNYEGAEALFENTLHHLREAKEKFVEVTKENTRKAKKEDEKDVNDRMISSLMSVFRERLEISEKIEDSET